MQIILLERIAKLGQMGDVVNVKDGFARNFLLPQGKALRANEENKARFESQRVDLEARNLERKGGAEEINKKLDGTSYVVIRSAGETGQLYGSVTTRDIAASLDGEGFKVARSQIILLAPIKTIGLHKVEVVLHPEVSANIVINVARSEDEAVRQTAGEDMSSRDAFDADSQADIDLAEVFDNPDDIVEELDADGEDSAAEETAEEEKEEK